MERCPHTPAQQGKGISMGIWTKTWGKKSGLPSIPWHRARPVLTVCPPPSPGWRRGSRERRDACGRIHPGRKKPLNKGGRLQLRLPRSSPQPSSQAHETLRMGLVPFASTQGPHALTQLFGVQVWQQRPKSGRYLPRKGMKTSSFCPESQTQFFI